MEMHDVDFFIYMFCCCNLEYNVVLFFALLGSVALYCVLLHSLHCTALHRVLLCHIVSCSRVTYTTVVYHNISHD